jgi:hypothetical protein
VDYSREVARIIGSLPPDRWLKHAGHVADRLKLPLMAVTEEVIDAGARWTDEPDGSIARELAVLRSSAPRMLVRRTPEASATTRNDHALAPAQVSPRPSPNVAR